MKEGPECSKRPVSAKQVRSNFNETSAAALKNLQLSELSGASGRSAFAAPPLARDSRLRFGETAFAWLACLAEAHASALGLA